MKFVYLTLVILILSVSIRAYDYQFRGGWQSYGINDPENLAKGINNVDYQALNYANAEFLYRYSETFNELNSDSCANFFCSSYILCNNTVFSETATEISCILKYGNVLIVTVIQHKVPRLNQSGITLQECEAFCDSTKDCNLILWFAGNATSKRGSFCELFYKYHNATFEQTVPIVKTCQNSCGLDWYERIDSANQCKSIRASVPNSYCQTYCTFTDSTKTNCTGVQSFMSSICECNSVTSGPDNCFSKSSSVPNSYCQTYCHITGATCSVDDHMQSICGCAM